MLSASWVSHLTFFRRNFFLISWRSILLSTWLDAIHRLAVLFFPIRIKKPSAAPLHRILLANCGGLGDVTMCAQVISEIKRHFPACRLGFIALQESQAALEIFPSIDWVHLVNYSAKPNQSTLKKFLHFLKFALIEQSNLAKEIQKLSYDCAIELRPFFPNMIPVFWKAGIPLRIGFNTGGNSFLLNAPLFSFQEKYISLNYSALLEKIGIFPSNQNKPLEIQKEKIEYPIDISSPYFVFHPSSSNPKKNFSVAFWRNLYEASRKRGLLIYFSGKGEQDNQMISKIVENQSYNLCDKLTWTQFAQLIRQSRGVVSVDSTAVHLAAFFQVPCAVLFKIVELHELWQPTIPCCSAFGIESPAKPEEIMEFLEKIKI